MNKNSANDAIFASWRGVPHRGDPRLIFATVLFCFLMVGIHWLGFNKIPIQIAFMVGVACGSDFVFDRLFRPEQKPLFPMSAVITGLGLTVLTHFGHSIWVGAIPVIIAMMSKYILTFQGRHVCNPGLCGIVLCLMLNQAWVSTAPVYQWGGGIMTGFYIVTAALFLFALKINRSILIASFIGFYVVNILLRGYVLQTDLPPLMQLSAIFLSPAFYLFSFFMITDPRTSPDDARGQIIMAGTIVAIDFLLNALYITHSFFYAGFAYFIGRWAILHLNARRADMPLKARLSFAFYRLALMTTVVLMAVYLYGRSPILNDQADAHTHAAADLKRSISASGLGLTEVDIGITGSRGDVLQRVDHRAAHVAKWFYSKGDAVIVADVNNDGWQDIFVTQPLKAASDRLQLYLNRGDWQFEKHVIGALSPLRDSPELEGSPVGGVFFDFDNDGDQDLLIVTLWGQTWVLKNHYEDDGVLRFTRVPFDRAHFNSGAVTIADMNADGLSDIIIGNLLMSHFPKQDGDGTQPEFSLFALPEPQYDGDRSPLAIMRRNPFNAENGGRNIIYLNRGEGNFESVDWFADDETRWTFDVTAGDVNRDGWPDLYVANTAGPDDLYLNNRGQGLKRIEGRGRYDIGRDSYRGMNASFADFDENGWLDIYVSNMHKPQLPEGSMLWMNDGNTHVKGFKAFKDHAYAMGLANEYRFGWGAAIFDIDRDGDQDMLQINGWLNNDYDEPSSTLSTDDNAVHCPSYVYKMLQIEQTPIAVHGYVDNWPDMRGQCLYPADQKRVFINDGGQYHDMAEHVGWGGLDNGRGIAYADFDNDGDYDVITSHMTSPPRVYRNDLGEGRDGDDMNGQWVGISLRGDGQSCSLDAHGTIVTRMRDGQRRHIFARNGLSAQSDKRVIFPAAPDVEEAFVIDWCGLGSMQETVRLNPGKYHHISQ